MVVKNTNVYFHGLSLNLFIVPPSVYRNKTGSPFVKLLLTQKSVESALVALSLTCLLFSQFCHTENFPFHFFQGGDLIKFFIVILLFFA